MGWEWHNRPHDEKGRWLKKHARGKVDVHIRIDRAAADRLRDRAAGQHMEIGEYLEAVLQRTWSAEERANEFAGRSLRSGERAEDQPEETTPEKVVDAALEAMRGELGACPDKPVHYYCRDVDDFDNDACERCWRDYLLRQG